MENIFHKLAKINFHWANKFSQLLEIMYTESLFKNKDCLR